MAMPTVHTMAAGEGDKGQASAVANCGCPWACKAGGPIGVPRSLHGTLSSVVLGRSHCQEVTGGGVQAH